MNVAILLAGGTGTRIGASVPKQFIKIMGKPILAYTLDVFEQNDNIDAIEIVCHKDWVEDVELMVKKYNISKFRWMCTGGGSFQESTMQGIFNLKDKLAADDIVVISFGVSPLTPQEDIDDSVRICKEHGNAICSASVDLCTCIMDDAYSSTQSILREKLRGFANPWSFKFGELCEAYEEAIQRDILKDLEPHTTSLYFALGKRIWFSRCTTMQAKITHKGDLDIFEGYLLLKQKREQESLEEKWRESK
ncbi:MAG: 2-C-methyl-D-erythritol 4-phosphate cytidylyltransferase [Phascolarctobacterium sp.]|nr:2-C-methyl-D-erythritol 4-phosphate cytidylyltransferase [Phascolarctobacterium sp.]